VRPSMLLWLRLLWLPIPLAAVCMPESEREKGSGSVARAKEPYHELSVGRELIAVMRQKGCDRSVWVKDI
jgi:hypothetical protein